MTTSTLLEAVLRSRVFFLASSGSYSDLKTITVKTGFIKIFKILIDEFVHFLHFFYWPFTAPKETFMIDNE